MSVNWKDDNEVKKFANKLKRYVETTDFPKLAEFAYQNDIHKDKLGYYYRKFKAAQANDGINQNAFVTAYEKSLMKQETYLNDLAIKRGQNAAPMFLLKALHGYKDHEVAKPAQTTVINLPNTANTSDKKLEDNLNSLIASAKEQNEPANKRKN